MKLPGHPCILRGLLTPAMRMVTIDALCTQYGDDRVDVTRFLPEEPYSMRDLVEMSLAEYIGALDKKSDLYLTDWSVFTQHPELFDIFKPMTRYFPDKRYLVTPQRVRRFLGDYDHGFGWMLIGRKGSRYQCHQDVFGMHAWLAQLEGKKRIVAFPPTSGATERTRIEEHLPGRVELTLDAGEVAYIPSNWWHIVTSVSARTLSVNSNFVTLELLPRFIRAVAGDLVDRLRG